jgi:hypothetical protein
VSYFQTPQKWRPAVHVYHAIHHNFTTIYHHDAHQNRQNPLQKEHSHHSHFFRPLKIKKISGLLFNTSTLDPLSVSLTLGALTVMAALAAIIPAGRAASVSPTDALRAE